MDTPTSFSTSRMLGRPPFVWHLPLDLAPVHGRGEGGSPKTV